MKAVKSDNSMRDAFPVLRMDYQQRLVHSNTTALPLLNSWNCRNGAKIPKQLLGQIPELKDSFTSATPRECVITFGDLRIWFDIVPFPQAGYIGLYGFHIESTVPETVPQNLRMAG
jgi:hypothetical protein